MELDAALDGLALAEATKSGFLAAFIALFKADKGSDGVVPPVEPTPAPVNALLTAARSGRRAGSPMRSRAAMVRRNMAGASSS